MATSLQIVALELSKAFVLYRQPRPDKAEFELLVKAWVDVLPDVNDAELCIAMRRVCALSRFFPVPADVTRQVEELRRQPVRTQLEALPERTRTFDEQIDLNREGATRILDMLRSKSFRPVRPDFRRVAEGFAEARQAEGVA